MKFYVTHEIAMPDKTWRRGRLAPVVSKKREDFTGKEKKPYEYRDKRCWYRAELTKNLGF